MFTKIPSIGKELVTELFNLNANMHKIAHEIKLSNQVKGKPSFDSHKHMIFSSKLLEPCKDTDIEILAYRAGAFKPRKIQIKVLDSKYEECNSNVEILSVSVFGLSQIINFDARSDDKKNQRGLISFFKEPVDVDWQVFGGSSGQGLQFVLHNLSQTPVKIYITIWGDPADSNFIGKHN